MVDSVAPHNFRRIHLVLDYVNENLQKNMSLRELAKVASVSEFHFHRLFQAYTGETLQEYIRRLRLEKAAIDLKYTKEEVTKIALRAGYETSASFGKAYKKYFKMSASEYRKENSILFPSSLDLKKMKAEIRKIAERKVVFARETGPYARSAMRAWERLIPFCIKNSLFEENSQYIGVYYDDPTVTDPEKLRAEACVTLDKEVTPTDGLAVKVIPAGKYAVFLHEGPYDKLIDTYQDIYGKWLPTTKEELRDMPSEELYLNEPSKVKPEELLTEICIPLK